MLEVERRGFLAGFSSLFAAPAVVRADSLMKISPIPIDPVQLYHGWLELNGAKLSTDQFPELAATVKSRWAFLFGKPTSVTLPDWSKVEIPGARQSFGDVEFAYAISTDAHDCGHPIGTIRQMIKRSGRRAPLVADRPFYGSLPAVDNQQDDEYVPTVYDQERGLVEEGRKYFQRQKEAARARQSRHKEWETAFRAREAELRGHAAESLPAGAPSETSHMEWYSGYATLKHPIFQVKAS